MPTNLLFSPNLCLKINQGVSERTFGFIPGKAVFQQTQLFASCTPNASDILCSFCCIVLKAQNICAVLFQQTAGFPFTSPHTNGRFEENCFTLWKINSCKDMNNAMSKFLLFLLWKNNIRCPTRPHLFLNEKQKGLIIQELGFVCMDTKTFPLRRCFFLCEGKRYWSCNQIGQRSQN